MLTNRPEFHLVDTAALHAGATPFSIYNTLAPEQIAHLFGNAGNRVVVCEEQFLARIRAALATGQTAVEHIVCVDGDAERHHRAGRAGGTRSADGFDFEASWRAVEPDDVLTIIYTSGTTGPPKGVELTHANLIAEIDATHAGRADERRRHRRSPTCPTRTSRTGGAPTTRSIVTGMQIITLADLKQMISVLPAGAADVLRRRPAGLVQAQGRRSRRAGGRDVAGEEAARHVGDRRSARTRARLHVRPATDPRGRCDCSTRSPSGSCSEHDPGPARASTG